MKGMKGMSGASEGLWGGILSRKDVLLKRSMVLILLAVLIAFFAATANNFLTLGNVTNLLRQTSVIGIMSVGFAFVMIAGGLDLSVGAAIAMVGCTAAICIVRADMNVVLSCVLGIGVAVAISSINAAFILVTKMPPFIGTLAMMQVLEGLAYMITNATPVYGLPDSIKIIGQGYLGFVPVPVIIMIACFVVGGFALNKTYFGRYIYAVGSNAEAARLSGLSVAKIQFLSYAVCGVFTGIAGIVMMSRVFSGQPNAGVGYELDVITACVVGGIAFSGGKGSITGLIQGVLVMGVLSNGLGVLGVDAYTQLVFKGVVLALVVGIDCFQQSRAHRSRIEVRSAAIEVAQPEATR
jgi:ribose transport system permease protein